MVGGKGAHFASSDVRMVFVVGCGHSGTTLLAAMLGAHRSIYAITHETRAFDASDVRAARLLFEHRHVPAALAKGATVLCEKTPHHVRRIPVIRKAFPGARIVVVVRDARDVAVSLMERSETLERAVHRWNSDNDLVRYEVERGGRDLMVVTYEEIIATPAKTLMAISAHIGVDYSPAMLEFYKDERTWFRGEDPHIRFRNWQVHQPLMDRRGRWKTILSDTEARYVEEQCRELMSFFGYLPTIPAPAWKRMLDSSWRRLRESLRPARRRLRRVLGRRRAPS